MKKIKNKNQKIKKWESMCLRRQELEFFTLKVYFNL